MGCPIVNLGTPWHSVKEDGQLGAAMVKLVPGHPGKPAAVITIPASLLVAVTVVPLMVPPTTLTAVVLLTKLTVYNPPVTVLQIGVDTVNIGG
ncbi:hypothetical protein GCM10027347_60130 [Larkinella harenae]